MLNSSITTSKKSRKPLPPPHPGEVLKDILGEAGLSANALSLRLRIPASRMTAILNGRRGISADTALRLARYFGTDAQTWLNLQMNYELETARLQSGERIRAEVTQAA